VFSAANKLSVPFLLYSNPWLSARPGDSGSIRSLRSSAWMAVFSSTQNTTACAGALRYSPITQAANLPRPAPISGFDTTPENFDLARQRGAAECVNPIAQATPIHEVIEA